jgi:hypothetical protein
MLPDWLAPLDVYNSERLLLQTPLDFQECTHRLRERTAAPRSLLSYLQSRNQRPVFGSVSEIGFTLTRRTRRSTLWLKPRIAGQWVPGPDGGTLIRTRLGCSVPVAFWMAAWWLILVVQTVVQTVAWLGLPEEARSSLGPLNVPVFMGAIGAGLTVFLHRQTQSERYFLLGIVQETLNAQVVPPVDAAPVPR